MSYLSKLKNKLSAFYTRRIKPLKWYVKYPIFAFTAFFASVIAIIIMLKIGMFGGIPSKKELLSINNPSASDIYADNDEIIGKYYFENRTNVSIDEIDSSVIQALIATEDERFYEHHGIDYQSLGRVFFKTFLLMDRSSGGGSTITQQLAKNLFKRQRFWLLSMPVNKIREMLIASKIEDVYTKDQILALYLNTVSWGSDIYGIRVAARRYFSSTPKNLKVEEAATLIGMLKATTNYNPLINKNASMERRNIVLRRMEAHGFISKSELQELIKKPIEIKPIQDSHNEGLATYFRESLRLELDNILKNYKKEDGTPYNLYTDGLKIYTTINIRMQELAEQAVEDHMKFIQKEFDNVWKKKAPWPDENYILDLMTRTDRYVDMKESGASDKEILKAFNTPVLMTIWDWNGDRQVKMSPMDSIKHYSRLYRAGLLSVDPLTGNVKAWVGGFNHKFMKYDNVKALRQVGSTFKPIVYAQALHAGFKPCDYFPNVVKTYPEWEDWTPTNIDGSEGGSYSMAAALAKSYNVIAAELAIRSGIDSVANMAKNMGISGKVPAYPAIALGAVDGSLMDMTRVFTTIANRGLRKELIYLRRIEDKHGNVIVDFEKNKPADKEVYSTEIGDMLIKLMENVVDHGTAASIRNVFRLEGPIAGKTGTSQEEADGWFVGFTPGLVTGVWVGGEAPVIKFRYGNLGQGSQSALPIWAKYNFKVKIDGKTKQYAGGSFAPVSDTLMSLFNCATFAELPNDSLNVAKDSLNVNPPVEDIPNNEGGD